MSFPPRVGADALYDRLGEGYSAVRRPDPRIAARIWGARSGMHGRW